MHDPTTSPLARRIVRRHQAAIVFRDIPVSPTRVEYSNGGRILAVELARMLEPTCGFVTGLRFRPSLAGRPNTVSWEALDENAEVVTGKLVLHAGLSDIEVVTWAEVIVEGATSGNPRT